MFSVDRGMPWTRPLLSQVALCRLCDDIKTRLRHQCVLQRCARNLGAGDVRKCALQLGKGRVRRSAIPKEHHPVILSWTSSTMIHPQSRLHAIEAAPMLNRKRSQGCCVGEKTRQNWLEVVGKKTDDRVDGRLSTGSEQSAPCSSTLAGPNTLR